MVVLDRSALTRSPLAGRMVFAVGARRSGTHWLQRMLMAHPSISGVPGETHLFSSGVKPLLERLHFGVLGSGQTGAIYAEPDVVLPLVRELCDALLLQHLKPQSAILCERTPEHAGATDVIAAIYPDARFVHIVRDGRDVTRSLSKHNFGPDSIPAAAREWRDSVTAARTQDRGRRMFEVRYEDLHADPATHMAELFGWMGVETSDEALEHPLAEAGAHRNRSPDGSGPGVGKWRSEWTHEELAAFAAVAGELLIELGYPELPTLVPARRTTLRARFRRGRERVPEPARAPIWRSRIVALDRFVGALAHDPAAAHALMTADARIPADLDSLLRVDEAPIGVQVRGECPIDGEGFLVDLTHRLTDGTLRDTRFKVEFRGELICAVDVYERASS